MESLKITIVQQAIVWEKPEENLQHLDLILQAVPVSESHLIVLPEMFTTGFTMNSHQLAEEMDGPALEWMKHTAREKNAVIMGSVIVKEQGAHYNRLLAVHPDGSFNQYDKRHLFRMSGEHEHFSPGNQSMIFKIGEWRVKPLICYDLRFPVWSRNRNDYDVLVYVANWPEVRRRVWNTLLSARAMENLSYVVGVNRVGIDGMGIQYCGDSMALNYYGEVISSHTEPTEWLETVDLDREALERFRNKFPAWRDADSFEIL